MATRDRDAPYVLQLCDEVLGIPGSREHRFDWLQGDISPKTGKTRGLPVDAFWETLGLVVEVMEGQHYNPVAIFDKPDVMTVSGVSRGEQRRIYDLRREKLIPEHGLALVHIRSTDFAMKSGKIDRHHETDSAVVRTALAAWIPAHRHT